MEKKVGRRNTVAFLHKKLSFDEDAKIEHITFNIQKEKNIEFLKRFADEEGFIDPPFLPVEIEGTMCVCPTDLYEGFYIAKFIKK